MIDEHHGKEFFEQMASCRANYRILGECIGKVCLERASKVLDIGCGNGLVIELLAEGGHDVYGIDGAEDALPFAAESVRERIYIVDLTAPIPKWPADHDLVICTETGEHLPESAADGLVALCASTTKRMICFSAAPPGQEWEGHINLQPPKYWLDKFAAHGWKLDAERTETLRMLMWERKAQHMYCKDNFHVLVPA